MRKLPATIALAAVASFALTACTDASSGGSSTGSSTDSSTAGAFDLSSIAKDDTIAAMLPADVADSGKLTVGTDTTYAPAEFVDTDGKTPIGYDIDIITAVAQVLGLEAEPQTAEFPGIIPALGTKFDVGISSFTITDERMDVANMISYFTAGEAFAVAKGNPEGYDASDVCGLTIAVQTGTVEDEGADELSKECTDAGKDAIDVLKYDSQADATTNLVGGKADLMYADSPIVAYAIEQTGGQIEQLGDVFDSAPQGVVVAKDDEELTTAVQAALQKLMDDGDLKKILDTWGGGEGALTTAELNPAAS